MTGPEDTGGSRRPRVLVHSDQQYWWDDHGLWTRQPFVRFASALGEHDVEVTLCGRLERGPRQGMVAVDRRTGFAGLPPSTTSAGPWRVARDAPTVLRRWWRALAVHDVVWLVGPNVWSLPFAIAARLRGVPVVLGVRQDLPRYVRFRHPGRRRAMVAATVLDAAFRCLARHRPAVVVGGALAVRYRDSPETLDIRVALIRRDDVAADAHRPRDGGRRRALSVGRLDREKNPLLLADVAALAPDWELHVCGDGPLEGELRERVVRLGAGARVVFHGQLDGDALLRRFAEADALVHVSWTEGVPQTILEAFADGLPVVATDVGGVATAVDGAALVVPPGDAAAVAAALGRLAASDALGAELARRGLRIAREHALEDETARVADLLRRASGVRDPRGTPAAAPAADQRPRRLRPPA